MLLSVWFSDAAMLKMQRRASFLLAFPGTPSAILKVFKFDIPKSFC